MNLLIVGPNEGEVFMQITVTINGHLGSDFTVHPHEIADADIHVLHDLEAASIGVSPTKDFIRRLQKRPFKRKNQVGIIPRIDMLTVEAQNALLKELEDHNESVIYVLGALNEQNVLTTILSRTSISYIATQKRNPVEEALEQLAAVMQKKTSVLSTYKEIASMEWTKQRAIKFLEILYQFIQSTGVTKEKLELLQQSGKYLNANIPPRHVISHLLLRLNQ